VSALVRCSNCQRPFVRPYNLSVTRKVTRRHFCSSECQKTEQRKTAMRKRALHFWTKVNIRGADDCWEWNGYRDPHGYGRYGRILAHRIAFELINSDPGELIVCHSCDNPACCNPSHLWPGTHADNIADMDAKGRRRTNTRRGEASNKAKLTADQARAIYRSSESNVVLAKRYSISDVAVTHIKHGRNWAHVTRDSKS
jgi:hypothetical protein